MKPWSKPQRLVVNQRAEVLPPTWCPRATGACVPTTVGNHGVFRSDDSRHVAGLICAAISAAREIVVAASFLLADQDIEHTLLVAAQRGVRVYLLLATEVRLEKEPREDSEFDQRALADHKKMLHSLAGWALIRSAPSFHAKVVLTDPGHRDARGFLLTANLTKEALSRNEELGVELSTAEVHAVFQHLRWAAWEAADHEILSPGRLSAVSGPLGMIAKPPSKDGVVATMHEPGTLRDGLLELIRAARRSITLASFGWEVDHPVVQALRARAREGIQVTVLARMRPAAMPALLALAGDGAKVFGFRWLHAKAVSVDNANAMVMSANLERHGLDTGFELGLRLGGARATALREILDGWVAAARHELRLEPRLGDIEGEAHVWQRDRLVPFTVATTAELTVADRIAASADSLQAEPPAMPPNGALPRPAHEIALCWNVHAPRLAAGATEVERKPSNGRAKGDPTVFHEGNNRIVVAVSRVEDLPRARTIASEAGAAAIVVREERP